MRMKGLEPPRLSASDPKSDAATNYATSARIVRRCKNTIFFQIFHIFLNKKNEFILYICIDLFFTDMTELRKYFLLFFLSIFSCYVFSQSLIGTQSNYAGSRSLSMNPALMSTSYLYSDLSIATTGFSFFNDFAYLKSKDFNKLLFSEGHTIPSYTMYGENYNFLIYDNPNMKPKKLYESLDVNMLSLMYTLDTKQNIGFSINARVYTSGTDIPYELPELCALKIEGNDFLLGYYQSSGAKAATMEWAELAMSYSRKVYDRYLNRIDVGASVKYLLGYSAAAVNIDNLDYEVIHKDTIMVNNIDSYIAYSLPLNYDADFVSGTVFDSSPVRGNGIALDLGFSFLRKKSIVYNTPRFVSACLMQKVDYSWRLSVSLMDLGFINFGKNAVDNRFLSEQTLQFNKRIFDNIDSFGDMINSLSGIYYDGDMSASLIGNSFKMGLPTTLRLQFDYNVVKCFYVNATVIQPINLFKYSVKAASQLMVEPRFESRYFDFCMPLSLRNYKHFMLGASARIGFITMGTHNLVSYLGIGDTNGMDFFISLKINFAKGGCNENKYDACWSADYGKYENRRRQ